MPKPVCVKCSREMTCVKSGAVELHAIVFRGPYEQWQGDLYRCPTCGCEITSGYGGRATWFHGDGEDARDKEPIAVAFERGCVTMPSDLVPTATAAVPDAVEELLRQLDGYAKALYDEDQPLSQVLHDAASTLRSLRDDLDRERKYRVNDHHDINRVAAQRDSAHTALRDLRERVAKLPRHVAPPVNGGDELLDCASVFSLIDATLIDLGVLDGK